ncbi:hypothetical protein B5E53_07830 [Eubacterium sp. An11]|uniref:hypothetical protein n=1 Tax=Eubacterium sp. An11 TaxID=1965542 RepID=UPI000B383D7B|nr:hypothetical protein [Eubacterium sp. An11]OUQ67896.1 hypothetical protein B5E53_07830 [Eubacterium sp. An11]
MLSWQCVHYRYDISVYEIALLREYHQKTAFRFENIRGLKAFIIYIEYLDDKAAKLFSKELYKATQEEKGNIALSDALARFVIFPISGTGIDKCLERQRENLNATAMKILHTIFFIKESNNIYCVLNLCMTDNMSFLVKGSQNIDFYSEKMPLTLIDENGDSDTL